MSQEWVQKQMQNFLFTFEEADKDKSGSLSFKEICDVLKAQGFKGSEDEAKAIFKNLDCDGNQSISKQEFIGAINKLPKMSIKEYSLRRMFKSLDRDGSGFLSREEIMDGTKRALVGIDIPDETISDLLIAFVKDKDSKIHYEEFLTVFGYELASDAVKEMFSKLDVDGSGSLTRDELYGAMKSDSGHEMTNEFVDKVCDLIIYLVGDSDKKISFSEFHSVWVKEREKATK